MQDMHVEEELGKTLDSRLMKRLLGYARPYRKALLFCLFLLLLITVAELAGPYLISLAIDNHINGDKDLSALMRIATVYGVLLVAIFVMGWSQQWLMQSTAKRIIRDMRHQIFAHLQEKPLAFFDRNPVGRLVTRVMNDTEALNEMYGNVLVTLVRDVLIMLGILLVMFALNWRLALIAVGLIPLLALSTYIYRRYAREAYRQVRVLLARINSMLSENISGMRVVQTFHREAQQFLRFEKINRQYFRAGYRELRAAAIFRPLMDLLYALGLALLIWFGSGQVMQGVVEFGILYAFVDYMNRFFQPIKELSEKFTILQSAMASSERIFQLLDNQEKIEDPSLPVQVGRLRGEICFDRVWFAYEGENWVLKDVSFTVRPGETLALVGATGAGKSSIISLLCRFYDIQKGRITIDGIDIREMSQEDLRRNVSVVMQDVFLFSGDILSNIRLNREDISEEEAKAAARAVSADTFIRSLPGGYHEPVMERGMTLSTGQKQLISLARTLAFNPSILVLDEATANIDTETEALIQEALDRVMEGRTSIVIAHRLSTIQNADQILVLHQGEIRERGTHEELLAAKGLYHKLYQLQFASPEESKNPRAS